MLVEILENYSYINGKKNCNLAICARNEKELNKVLTIINQYSGKHMIFPIDLEHPEGPSQLFQKLKNYKILPDIIVHNLGGSRQVTDTNFSRQDLAKVWELNLGISHEITTLIYYHK